MTDKELIQLTTWHYVMDIHEPEDYWYSIDHPR
jgi:hypothetical protein